MNPIHSGVDLYCIQTNICTPFVHDFIPYSEEYAPRWYMTCIMPYYVYFQPYYHYYHCCCSTVAVRLSGMAFKGDPTLLAADNMHAPHFCKAWIILHVSQHRRHDLCGFLGNMENPMIQQLIYPNNLGPRT